MLPRLRNKTLRESSLVYGSLSVTKEVALVNVPISKALQLVSFGRAQSFDEIMRKFIELGRFIMCFHELVSNNGRWRITSLELYLKTSSDIWQDVYTHCNREQLNAATWYVHDDGRRGPTYSGIDITCGSKMTGVHCGLLIRELNNERRWVFQRIVRGNRESFPRLGNTWIDDERGVISNIHAKSIDTEIGALRLLPASERQEQLFIGPRVGLSRKGDNSISSEGISFRTAPLRLATSQTSYLKTLMREVCA